MKRGLVEFLLAGALFFSSCNKEEFFRDADLNGNGTSEYIQGRTARDGYCLYYFDGSAESSFNYSSDTNYVLKGLKYRPINPHVWDFSDDGFPEIVYSYPGEKGIETFVVDNKDGVLGEPKIIGD